MSKRTGGVPYHAVPEWVKWARAHAKETLTGPALDSEWKRINDEWEASPEWKQFDDEWERID